MITKNVRRLALLLAAAGALTIASALSAQASIVDLTTVGASGTINGATFLQTGLQPTGTGVLDPFLRIQETGNEAGYNTSSVTPKSPLDDKAGIWTHDLLVSSLKVVNYNGVDSYQFVLDIAQQQDKNDHFLSLNQVEIFRAAAGGQNGGSQDSDGRLTGVSGLTLVWDMNPGGGHDNGVTLDSALSHGNGSGDMYLYVPKAAIDSAPGANLVFYSQFGHPPGTYESNGSFEEWAAVVPEPSTIVAGLLLLLPFGASALRIVRQNRRN